MKISDLFKTIEVKIPDTDIVIKVKEDLMIILDEKLGEMPIFFAEIKSIEPRAAKREFKK